MNVSTVIGGKYEIQKEIKRGGFGIIYQGLDTNFDKKVAIKAIDPELLGEARYVDMFQHEALNIARLNHQNIVQVFDIRRGEAGQIYIVMEFIDGFDLMRVIRACRKNQRALPVTLVAHVISEVCNGLDYAHNRRNPETKELLNLIHKDISPLNIMLSRSGEVKIIDFGMTGFLQQSERRFSQVEIQGNVRYMAPEQARQSENLDRRADIFSLGVVLFELLTGERLIASNNLQQIVEKLIVGNFDLSRLRSDDIPEKLQQVVRKALQHRPADRYATANEMYRDLMHYLILTNPTTNFTSELVGFLDEVDPGSVIESEDRFGATPRVTDVVDQEHETELEGSQFENGASASEFQAHDDGSTTQQVAEKLPEAAEALAEPEQQADESEKIDEDLNSTPTDPEDAKSEQPPKYYSFVEDEDDNNQKTIIDVVRLSARTHQKGIVVGLASILAAVILFTVVDTFANVTPLGTAIYDYLFPPAIKVVSVPPGASVYLDDRLHRQTTPLSLDEISPGVHKLMLTLPQYESIVKSINVPRQGELRLSGEAKRHASQPYVLKFKNRFDINSEPAGANIIIDGIRLGQVTPATVFWDVSDVPSRIDLEIAGLPVLSGLEINSVDEQESISDRRLWKVSKPISDKAHYVIEGIFHKNLTISSQPRLADIYYDGSEKPVGVTGISGDMMLPMGEHRFLLRKEGYLPRNFVVDVNENTRDIIHQDLTRTVRIFSKDALAGGDKDLGATIVSISTGTNSKSYNKSTPAIFELLPFAYKAVVKKSGYHDVVVEIGANDRSVVAKMDPLYYELSVEAVDAITSAPIGAAKILYRPENSPAPDEVLGTTDGQGKISGKLMPGSYEVAIEKDGYRVQKKTIQLRADGANQLTFRLTALR